MKKKSFIHLPSDIYSLAYLIHCSSLKDHSSPLGHLISNHCCPVHHTCSALPKHLSGPELHALEVRVKWNNNDDYDKKDNCISLQCDDCSDMDSIEVTKLMMHQQCRICCGFDLRGHCMLVRFKPCCQHFYSKLKLLLVSIAQKSGSYLPY